MHLRWERLPQRSQRPGKLFEEDMKDLKDVPAEGMMGAEKTAVWAAADEALTLAAGIRRAVAGAAAGAGAADWMRCPAEGVLQGKSQWGRRPMMPGWRGQSWSRSWSPRRMPR